MLHTETVSTCNSYSIIKQYNALIGLGMVMIILVSMIVVEATVVLFLHVVRPSKYLKTATREARKFSVLQNLSRCV